MESVSTTLVAWIDIYVRRHFFFSRKMIGYWFLWRIQTYRKKAVVMKRILSIKLRLPMVDPTHLVDGLLWHNFCFFTWPGPIIWISRKWPVWFTVFSHDRSRISPWIKSMSNELDNTCPVFASQLSCNYDVIANRLWRHHQNVNRANETRG